MVLVRVAPSGDEVAIASGEARIVVHGESSVPRQFVERTSKARYVALSWSERLIAVGLDSGAVVVWDVLRGVKQGSGDAAWPSPISSICWDGTRVVAASAAQPRLAAWRLSDDGLVAEPAIKADKRGVSAIAAAKGVLACASTRLRLIDDKPHTVKGCALASPASDVAFARNGRFVAVAGDRSVLVVDTTSVLPLVTLAFEAALSALTVRCVGKRTVKLDVAVVCDDGKVRVARALASAEKWTVDAARPFLKADACVFAAEDAPRLVVSDVRGTKRSVTYEEDGRLVADIPNEASSTKQKVTKTEPERPPDLVGALDALPPVDRKRRRDDDDEVLGDKLAALEAKTLAAEAKRRAVEEAARHIPAPSATVASALAQAVRSSDEVMLDEVLQQRDQTVIDATLDKLDAALAVPLLRHLTSRIEKRPNAAIPLSAWTAALLVRHSTFLARHPDAPKDLARINLVVQKRAALLPYFIALQGRFDLALSRLHDAPAHAHQHPQNEVVFTKDSFVFTKRLDDSTRTADDDVHVEQGRDDNDDNSDDAEDDDEEDEEDENDA